MMIEVKWAEPKGQPTEVLLNLDEIAYCNRVTKDDIPRIDKNKMIVDYIHIQLKSGTDLLLADGEKLYNFIKDYNKIKAE